MPSIVNDNLDTLTMISFQSITVINDGSVVYPVDTAALAQWESTHGPITAQNYEKFCLDVPNTLPDVMPGSAEMIDVCQALREAGANYRHLTN